MGPTLCLAFGGCGLGLGDTTNNSSDSDLLVVENSYDDHKTAATMTPSSPLAKSYKWTNGLMWTRTRSAKPQNIPKPSNPKQVSEPETFEPSTEP